MKTLTLFRHAKSGWDSPVSRDFDRPINERGVRGARMMGHHLRDAGWGFDYVISSPAVRCTETLDAFWEGYGRILHPNWDRRIYLASGATLLDVVNDLPGDAERVLMCGHNPGIEDLIFMLVPDAKGDALRDTVEEKFPTAAVAELKIDCVNWANACEGSAKFTRLMRPRDLDPSLGPDAD
jgi:phosphohistidine phosphatase